MALSMECLLPNPTDYSAYRTRFLILIFIPFCAPPILFLALLQSFGYHLYLSAWLAYPLSILIWNTARLKYTEYVEWHEARRMGAEPIPRLVGRWPGNLDIVYTIATQLGARYPHVVLLELLESSGHRTANARMLWGNQIFTLDENVEKYVLATGFDKFKKAVVVKEAFSSFLGEGIFNVDGDLWKTHRATARPFFIRERISDFEIFERHAQTALGLIKASGSTPVDIQELLSRFTLDAGGSFLFGTELNTLSHPLPIPGHSSLGPKGSTSPGSFGSFATSFEAAQQLCTRRSRLGVIWPLLEFFHDKSSKDVRVIKEFLDPLVEGALEVKRGREEKGLPLEREEGSFLEYMVAGTDDKKLIEMQLLNILLAARDTTSALLTFTIYNLSRYPHVLSTLRSEILSICPAGRCPTYDDIKKMKYLRAVLNETLRLYPPVTGNGRAAPTATSIPLPSSSSSPSPTSLYVPAGAIVFYSSFWIHRRKDLWGLDADIYDPTRWLDERLELVVKNPFIFIPFHAGPRICLGQQFALNQASYFLISLLQQFSSLTLAPAFQPPGSLPPESWKGEVGGASQEKVWPASAITMFVKGGLWMSFGNEESA
ncbi:cytochrome P450 [Sistotremastrum niveocremeum HHB9708]|uniref:Cytochrome P450 n=1 Tax=Sistotremastrum niveocremeum HHB9708 TaxID=1314777 RepID=A0A164WRE5_9AGAM|nr:cytochrome P450 [Sistotremastrum niveocremeum HHB9708]